MEIDTTTEKEVLIVDGVSLKNLVQLIFIGDDILYFLAKMPHSRTICIKLNEKIELSQQLLKVLPQYYLENKHYFYQEKYLKAFEDLFKLYQQTLQFLKNLKNKSKVVRLANNDKYRKFVYSALVGLDIGTSQLKLSLFITKNFEKLVLEKLPDIPTAIEIGNEDKILQSDIKSMHWSNWIQKEAKGNNGSSHHFDTILNSNKNELTDFKRLTQLDFTNVETLNLLKKIEIPNSNIVPILDTVPREGNKFKVYKRKYKGQFVAEKMVNDKFEVVGLINMYKSQILADSQLSICEFILPILGISIRNGSLGLICEYSELGSLKTYLETNATLSYESQLNLTQNILEGLAFLHGKGILHKDLRTSNIIVSDDFKAKLTGFEFTSYCSTNYQGTEIFDSILGSDQFRWLAPEKLQGYNDSTKACDIFSLGTVIWSIFSLQYPYAKLSRKKVELTLMQGKRENLNLIPTNIQPIVAACWKQVGHNRPEIKDVLEVFGWLYNNAVKANIDNKSLARSKQGDDFGLNLYFEEGKTEDNQLISNKRNSIEENDISFIFNCYSYDFNLEEDRRIYYSTYSLDNFKSNYVTVNSNKNLNFTNLSEDLTKFNYTNLIPQPAPTTPDSLIDRSKNFKHTRNTSQFTVDSFESNASNFHKTNIKINGARFKFIMEENEIDFQQSHYNTSFGLDEHNVNIPNLRHSRSEATLQTNIEFQLDLESNNLIATDTNHISNYSIAPDTSFTRNNKLNQFDLQLEEAIELYNSNRKLEAYQLFDKLSKLTDTTDTNTDIDIDTFNTNMSITVYYLGVFYFWGEPHVCDINYQLAYHHFKLSASLNNSDAIHHLGLYYLSSEAGKVNCIKAFKLFKKAAYLGNKNGYFHLGICYINGKGTLIDKEKAAQHFRKAHELGHPSAKSYL